MASKNVRRGLLLAGLKRNVALYLGTTLLVSMLGLVGVKVDQDIIKLDYDQQAAVATMAKSIDGISVRVNKDIDVSESSLADELFDDIGKHPDAMEDIVHILEAKSADMQVTNEVECLAMHDVLNREIQNFKAKPAVEHLNRAVEVHDFLVRHCKVQPKSTNQK